MRLNIGSMLSNLMSVARHSRYSIPAAGIAESASPLGTRPKPIQSPSPFAYTSSSVKTMIIGRQQTSQS